MSEPTRPSEHAEDHDDGQVRDGVRLLYQGLTELAPGTAGPGEGWQRDGHEVCTIQHPEAATWCPNQCIFARDPVRFDGLVDELRGDTATLRIARDHRPAGSSVWGVHARNREQNFALNLLMDPDIDIVTLLGTAGSGKTLLALAAGLTQTLDDKRYREIVVTRATVPVGDDIGFLPGTEEEKMTPWMGALVDNLEVLTESDTGGSWSRAAAQDLLNNRIKVRSMNFMRGRTFLNRYVILDEAQNLTRKQMKTLITRAGPGSKMVCLGNVAQIDTPDLAETTSGLTYVVDRMKSWAHSGHVTLRRAERSRLADYANEVL